jgi:protein-disulfide isomerase
MSRYLPTIRGNWQTLLLLTLLGLSVAGSLSAIAEELPAVVATVQEQPISAAELTSSLRGELLRLEMQRYEVLKAGLDKLIASRLMQLEADKRGISTTQLEQAEIVAKVEPISSEQVKAFYEANQNRIRQPLEQIAPRIQAYLQQQAQEQREQNFINELRQHYTVTTALSAPTVEVSSDDDPFLGPQNAPVTIVEFSDFQCPYCRRVQPTLKRLMETYEGKIKWVFRDFPLRNIHPQAQKAAEAAQCAAEQQKFWPYHDKLFAAAELQVDDLKRYAKELGLNTTQFDTCLDTSKYDKEIEADMQDGQNAGVSATPSFFINGQALSGAVPYERFQELIEAALAQSQNAQRGKP